MPHDYVCRSQEGSIVLAKQLFGGLMWAIWAYKDCAFDSGHRLLHDILVTVIVSFL